MLDCQSTEFAPAERSDPSELAAQIKQVDDFIGPSCVLNMLPEGILVLNRNRQIVFANKTTQKLLEPGDPQQIYGMRPGELLDCLHASESPGGCGTTRFCSACGAVKAILKGLEGQEAVEECHLIQKKSGNALDLRVWVSPLSIDGQQFDLFFISDISDEKRRYVLERIFFHDILNTASGIFGFAELLGVVGEAELKECQDHLYILSQQLIEEIHSQRDLMKAENHELTVTFKQVDALHFINELAALYKGHEVARSKKISIIQGSREVAFQTDAVLLARVLGNMLKNALEASEGGETVSIGCEVIDKAVRFQVHNHAYI